MEHEELPQRVHELPREMEWHIVEIGDHHEKEAKEPLAQDIQQDALQAYEFHLVDQEVYKILQFKEKNCHHKWSKYQKLQEAEGVGNDKNLKQTTRPLNFWAPRLVFVLGVVL